MLDLDIDMQTLRDVLPLFKIYLHVFIGCWASC